MSPPLHGRHGSLYVGPVSSADSTDKAVQIAGADGSTTQPTKSTAYNGNTVAWGAPRPNPYLSPSS